MKAKQVYVIIILMVMLGFVAGFSAPAWAKAKPIEIVFSTYMPTSYEYLVLPLKHFAEKVEKQSEGRLRFKFYHSGQL